MTDTPPPVAKEASVSPHSELDAVKELQLLIDEQESDKGMPSSAEFFYYYGHGTSRRGYMKQREAENNPWEGYSEQQTKFCERMFILANDFDSLFTTIHKIEWLTLQWLEERLGEPEWSSYVSGDVHLFHAEMRSIFDSIAKCVLISLDNKVGQVCADEANFSFNDLQGFCQNPKTTSRAAIFFGQELTDLIKDLHWFSDARAMRDAIVHYEKDIQMGYAKPAHAVAFRTVYGTAERGAYKGPEQFKLNDGYINLRPYFGYYFGRLWFFLNEFSRHIGAKLELEKGNFVWVPQRIGPAINCMKQTVALLNAKLSAQQS